MGKVLDIFFQDILTDPNIRKYNILASIETEIFGKVACKESSLLSSSKFW